MKKINYSEGGKNTNFTYYWLGKIINKIVKKKLLKKTGKLTFFR